VTNLLEENDRFITVRSKFSEIAPVPSVQFATRVRTSRFVRLR